MPIGLSTAIIGAGALAAGATIYGSSQAASAQTHAANSATNAQLDMFNRTQQNLNPFIQSGQGAIGQTQALLGQGPQGSAGIMNTLQNLPGYQFIKSQGLQGVQNGFAAQGLGSSGAALRGAADYSENLANSYYQNFFGNLMSQQQLGANAAAGLGGYATQTGGNIGANLIGAGNAQGAASIAQGNAIGGIGNSVASAALYNQFAPGGGGGLFGNLFSPQATFANGNWTPGSGGFPVS